MEGEGKEGGREGGREERRTEEISTQWTMPKLLCKWLWNFLLEVEDGLLPSLLHILQDVHIHPVAHSKGIQCCPGDTQSGLCWEGSHKQRQS